MGSVVVIYLGSRTRTRGREEAAAVRSGGAQRGLEGYRKSAPFSAIYSNL